MTQWDEVRRYLAGSKDALQASTARFPLVNLDQQAGDLRLVQRAKENDTPSAGQDPAERDIVRYIRQRAQEAHGEYNAQLDLYDARLRQSAVGDEGFVLIMDAAERGLGNFKAQCEEDRLPLMTADRRARQVEAELLDFQRKHGREQVAPVVVTSGERWMSAGIIAFLLLVESFINGLFFASGSEQGLIGGVGQAVALSIVNLGLAALLGAVAVRLTRHRFLFPKLFGWLLVVFSVVAALGVNLVIAHYREAFGAAQGQPVDFDAVLNGVLTQPWVIGDLMSWVLGVLGLIAFALAAWKFHALDDPYPGYGRIARKHEHALDELHVGRTVCIENLRVHRDGATDEMRTVLADIATKKRDFELALKARARLRQDYLHNLEHLQNACAQLGAIYRQARPFPPPATLRELSADLEPPPDFISSFSSNDTAVHQRAIDTMQDYIHKISSAYSDAVDSVSHTSAPWETPRAATFG